MDKLTSHVAYDSISYSLDSLSFSGLVAIQDHQPKLPSPNRAKAKGKQSIRSVTDKS